MSDESNEPKFGAGHASAMARQGLAELRAALYTDSNVAQPPQYGMYGTKTPGEVQREIDASADGGRGGGGSMLESYLEQSGPQPETQPNQDRADGPERE